MPPGKVHAAFSRMERSLQGKCCKKQFAACAGMHAGYGRMTENAEEEEDMVAFDLLGEAEDLLAKDKLLPAQEAKVRSLLEQAGALLKAKPKPEGKPPRARARTKQAEPVGAKPARAKPKPDQAEAAEPSRRA